MVRLLIFAALVTEMGTGAPATAQTSNAPTDNELHAAYCDGALSYEIEDFKSVQKPSSPGEIESEI